MARIVVVGAGVAGLGAALALGRAGHEVTVVERDATPLPAGPRRGVLVGPARRPAGAPQPRLPRPAAQPAARPPPRRAGGAARRRRHRAPLRRGHARHHRGPQPRARATRTSWPWPAVARPSSGCCARPPWPSPGVSLLDGVVVDGLAADRRPERACAAPPACTWPTAAPSTATSWCWPAAAAATSPPGSTAIGAATVDEDDEDTGIVYWSRFYRLTGEAPVERGTDRRRPRLPEVRGVPGRQRHLLGHPRHVRTRTPRCARSPPPSGSTPPPPRCSRSGRGSRRA